MAVNLVVAAKFAALSQQGKSDQLERIDLEATKLMVLFAGKYHETPRSQWPQGL